MLIKSLHIEQRMVSHGSRLRRLLVIIEQKHLRPLLLFESLDRVCEHRGDTFGKPIAEPDAEASELAGASAACIQEANTIESAIPEGKALCLNG